MSQLNVKKDSYVGGIASGVPKLSPGGPVSCKV